MLLDLRHIHSDNGIVLPALFALSIPDATLSENQTEGRLDQ
jgi:hypothetical protein